MTASSAISEEYFKDVKNHVFINIKNNPLVAFLKTHLNVLSGTMKLVAAMSKKPSKAIFDNSDTTVSNEDIETTSEAYETLKDAEEEQNEHQDSTASLECECPEVNIGSTISDDSNNNHTANSYTNGSPIIPIDLSLPKITNSLIDDLSSILKVDKIEGYNIEHSGLEISVADLCATHYENDDNEANLEESESNKENMMKVNKKSTLTLKTYSSTPNSSSTAREKLIKLLNPVSDNNSEYNSTFISENANTYNYLNLQDEWGGLLKNKKTSHYAKKDPDIENKHKRPKSKSKIGLLINEFLLKLIKGKLIATDIQPPAYFM
ncbi:hypothetical protein EVAR_714_1 [Eumeta japonica]|uniref:Uncharacterized protein n=1 Tax=Eumeta variegata TaxID=151549 RepID=A0A4C1SDW8_EUMVA|nr:hypothetical protein EVAR_714_1 [Eumeta japonica]